MHHTFDATVIDLPNSCLKIQKFGTKCENMIMWSFYGQPETANLEYQFWNSGIKLKFKEDVIQCRICLDPTKGIPMLWCEEKYQKVLPLAIHSSICDNFNVSSILQIVFKMSELSNFPEIDTVDNLSEWASRFEPPELYSNFFEKLNVKNCVLTSSGYTTKVNIDSKLLSVNHIFSVSSEWFTREHLLKFEGSSAVFLSAMRIKNDDLIAFLNNWLSGENTKLESMIITTYSFGRQLFDKNTILHNFETIPWDSKKRAGRFKYPSSTWTLACTTDALDCTQQVDIERKSDGRLATVFIEGYKFRFFVWHNRFPDTSIDQPITFQYNNKTHYRLGDISF